MARAGLKHWMLHNDQLAHELDETLKLSPGYDPVRDADPALTFHAPLLTGPDSIPGAIRAIVERNSEGTYQAPRGAFLLSALDDESRHEYAPNDEPLGVLMEPASTNKCENYNANPDEALTNLSLISGTGTLTRVNRAAELKAAGLDRVCSDGNVIRLEGETTYRIRAIGPSNNTNEHTLTCWARAVVGEGRLRWDNSDPSFTAFTNADFQRIIYTSIPSASANWSIQAQPGAIVEFVLNQLEEQPVPTSVIVTEGAATSRAVDQLSYPMAGEPKGLEEGDPFVNDPDGWQVDPEIVVTKGAVTASNTTADRSAAYDNNNIPVDTDKFYEVTYTIESMNGGSVRSLILDEDAAYGLSAWRSEPGTYTDILTPTIPGGGGYRNTVAVQFSNGMVQGVVSDLRCRELTSILNQTEGMAALLWRPSYDEAQAQDNVQRGLVVLRDGNTSLMYLNTVGNAAFGTSDGASFPGITIVGGLLADTDYLILVRWLTGTGYQIGYKQGGIVRWGAQVAYTGAYAEEGFIKLHHFPTSPEHYRDLYLWAEDRGPAWLENFFAGVAN